MEEDLLVVKCRVDGQKAPTADTLLAAALRPFFEVVLLLLVRCVSCIQLSGMLTFMKYLNDNI